MIHGLRRTAMPPAMTDDELVALALMRGTRWSGPLPTVDATDADALLAVAQRGVRAMVTRGLMAGGRGAEPAPVEPLLAGLGPALAGRVVLSMFGATRDLRLVPGAPTGAVFLGPDRNVLADSVSALGVHYFSTGTLEAALATVVRVAEEVVRRGVPVAADGQERFADELVLCVVEASLPGEAVTALVVEHGAWSVVEIGSVGVPVPRARPDSIEDAVARIARGAL